MSLTEVEWGTGTPGRAIVRITPTTSRAMAARRPTTSTLEMTLLSRISSRCSSRTCGVAVAEGLIVR